MQSVWQNPQQNPQAVNIQLRNKDLGGIKYDGGEKNEEAGDGDGWGGLTPAGELELVGAAFKCSL